MRFFILERFVDAQPSFDAQKRIYVFVMVTCNIFLQMNYFKKLHFKFEKLKVNISNFEKLKVNISNFNVCKHNNLFLLHVIISL